MQSVARRWTSNTHTCPYVYVSLTSPSRYQAQHCSHGFSLWEGGGHVQEQHQGCRGVSVVLWIPYCVTVMNIVMSTLEDCVLWLLHTTSVCPACFVYVSGWCSCSTCRAPQVYQAVGRMLLCLWSLFHKSLYEFHSITFPLIDTPPFLLYSSFTAYSWYTVAHNMYTVCVHVWLMTLNQVPVIILWLNECANCLGDPNH